VAVATLGRMAAHVQHGRQLALRRLGTIQVAGDIQAGLALKVELLDRYVLFVALYLPSNRGMERRFLRQRPKAEHVKIFLPQSWAAMLPLFKRRRSIPHALAEARGFPGQILVNHFVARLLLGRRLGASGSGE